MAVETAAGTRLYIGPIVADTVDLQAEFEGLSYTEVGEVEDGGEIGDEVGITTFVSLKDRRVRKLKTTYDAGTVQLVVGFDSGDAGQAALEAALASDSNYAVKITLDDGSAGSPSSPTTIYCRAKVASGRIRIGAADNVVRKAISLAVDSGVIIVPAV